MAESPTQRTICGRLRHKFGAKQVERDGAKFQSKKEARYYDKLVLARQSGELLFFLRQVRFDLPGGVVYRLDFLEFWADGTVQCTDVKGHRTPEYIAKKKQVEALYPVEIAEA